jgi:LemA protein
MPLLIILVAIAFVVAILVGYAVTIYNGLILVKNNIQKAWGNIDVLLKQRHDEIPKLVKTCEGYMQYEKKTLTEIIALRNSAASATGIADRAQKEGQLSTALGRLFALSENYPDLKAQSTFQNLQKRITDLENQIADRREFYNESVNNYNIRIQSFPDAILAGQMNLQPQTMFKIDETDRQDVDVSLNVP